MKTLELGITTKALVATPNEHSILMNQSEFWDVINPLNKALFGFAMRMLRDSQSAEDALQDVLEKLWKMRNKIHPEGNVKALAMTMMKNRCIDLIKRNGRYVPESEMKTERTIESSYENTNLIDLLKQRMDLLTTQQRLIVELKDFQGFSYAEIAEITQLNVNALRVSLSRARKILTEPLRNDWR